MGYYSGDRYRTDRDYRQSRGGRDFSREAGREGSARGYYGPRGYRGGGRRDMDYDPDERGFFDRAADEVRSWFGDDDAERRRERDDYYDRPYGDPRDPGSRAGFYESSRHRGYAPFTGQQSGHARQTNRRDTSWRHEDDDYDSHYHAWRQDRMNELDRDYHEYQAENRNRFNQSFNNWRGRRTAQRDCLNQVQEHAEVVGSDGEHVGKVDKVSGDRIILTKADPDAGGHHHSIPSRWIDRVDNGKVILEKTAAQAHQEWRDTERDQDANGPHYLDRAFSGTYGNYYF